MKKYSFLAKLITAILLFVIICAFFATSAFAANNGAVNSNDYSKPGAAAITTLTSDEILARLIGEELPEVEAAYLELYGEYKIDYGTYLPSGIVGIGRDEATGNFTVKASKYSYTAANGTEVTFLPKNVVLGDKTVEFSAQEDDKFVADFEAGDYNENVKARVLYETEIEISERDVNILLNKAYNDAAMWKKAIGEEEEKYKNALAEYEKNSALYNEYLAAVAEYESLRVLYDAYKTEKATYDRKLKLYNDYLLALSYYNSDYARYLEYEEALKLYNENYAAYREYIEIRDNYDELLQKYEKYSKDIVIVRDQLAIIDGIKAMSTDLKRSVYNAVIIGTTVTQVIENKDAIANQTVGVQAEIVEAAGEATENLRELCTEYFEIEGEAQKYAYYVVNYEGLRSNFTTLFISLDTMYSNSKVRLVLKEKGIQEKYEILLAQLYYVVNALNDGPVYNYDKTAVYDQNYVINTITGNTPIACLDNVPYIIDKENATPLKTGYPVEAKEPVLNEVSEPVRPNFVAKPIAPEPVNNPGNPPDAVAEPKVPVFVPDPGEAPKPYEVDELVRTLVNNSQSLTRRDNVSGSRMLTIEVEILKQLGSVDMLEVMFLDEDGTPLCDTVLVDKGTYADYSGPVPQKQEDAEASYDFIGWQDSLGNPCDITNIESNLILYPLYKKNTKVYIITWNIDGSLIKEELEYGLMPVPPSNPEKPDKEFYEYVFKGWDKTIVSVSGNATYTAEFKGEPICTDEKGVAVLLSKNEEGYLIDLLTHKDTKVDLSKIISRLGKNDSITIKCKNHTVTLYPETIEKMVSVNAVSVLVEEIVMQGASGCAMNVKFCGSDGKEIPVSENPELEGVKVGITKKLDYEDNENVLLYYVENEERVSVRASYKYSILNADCAVGKTYYAVVEYPVNILPSGEVNIDTVSVARKGEFVKVSLSNVPLGAVVEMVYYLDSEGNRVEIKNGGFYMISETVFIGVEYHIPIYTITFVADGKVIYTTQHKYGETVSVPEVPKKASDSKYSYSQGFWSPAVVKVTGDAVYEARYLSSEIIKKEEPGGVQIFSGLTLFGKEIIPPFSVTMTQSLVDLGALLALAAFYLCAVVLPLGIIIIIKSIRRAHR